MTARAPTTETERRLAASVKLAEIRNWLRTIASEMDADWPDVPDMVKRWRRLLRNIDADVAEFGDMARALADQRGRGDGGVMAYYRSGVSFPSRALGTDGARGASFLSVEAGSSTASEPAPAGLGAPLLTGRSSAPEGRATQQRDVRRSWGGPVTNPAPVYLPRCGWCGTPMPLTRGSTGICSYCSLRELLREAVTGLLVVASVPGMWVVGAAVMR